MEPREPIINCESGLFVEHDQRCCVMYGKHAVYTQEGVFLPSWEAQGKGWRLIKIRTPLQRFVVKFFFGV